MSRVSSIKIQISLKTIQRRITRTTGVMQTKWKIIYYAKKEPRPAKEIANLVNKWQEAKKKSRDEYEFFNDDCITVTTIVVQKTIAAFNKYGELAIPKNKKKTRNRAYLSYEKEDFFLRPFLRYGKLTNVNELHTAYEKQFGYAVHKSTIYRMLKRHAKQYYY